MLAATKIYRDIPFAHRQHTHDGHCRVVHGHNWEITLEFHASELDANGFVVDFGKLKRIKDWIELHLDHKLVLSYQDPDIGVFTKHPELFDITVVEACSCEGLAQVLFEAFQPIVMEASNNRAWIHSVEVREDSKNAAKYTDVAGFPEGV
jgi:6-pyruvoyltetrahydropterin/6-carboxytetrahydropterin synthase